jgi:arginase family enzyme
LPASSISAMCHSEVVSASKTVSRISPPFITRCTMLVSGHECGRRPFHHLSHSHRAGPRRPSGLVHIDAHCDSAGSMTSQIHHGGPFRLAVLDGVVDPTLTIQIGIRGSAELRGIFL